MRVELAKLDAERAGEQQSDGWSNEQVEAITRWWEDFEKRAVSVPVKGNLDPTLECFHRDRFSDTRAVFLDARVVNETLHALGCEVRLQWKTERITLRNGKEQEQVHVPKGPVPHGAAKWRNLPEKRCIKV